MPRFFQKLQDSHRPFCTAVIAAAGSSSRMGEQGNKLLLPLGDWPVLVHTLTAVSLSSRVDEIIIAAREEDIVPFSQLCHTYSIGLNKPVKVVRGGETRAESVLMATLEADSRAELIAVQDGDRPLVQVELIDRVIDKAARCDAAAPAIPLRDTVKITNGDQVLETPDRSTLAAVQTPQVFQADLLKAALQAAAQNHWPVTDDCSAVERLGKTVYLVEGDPENLKITLPVDMIVAEAILEERER